MTTFLTNAGEHLKPVIETPMDRRTTKASNTASNTESSPSVRDLSVLCVERRLILIAAGTHTTVSGGGFCHFQADWCIQTVSIRAITINGKVRSSPCSGLFVPMLN